MHFNVAPESIVRILKSNFQPSAERAAEQDVIKEQKRKQNIASNLARVKEEQHAEWLKNKDDKRVKSRSSTLIKLGAPKRAIEME